MRSKEERRLKRARKNSKRLWYKVMHQKVKPNPFIYGLEVFGAVTVEILRRLMWIMLMYAGIGVVAGFCVAIFLWNKYKPLYEQYSTEARNYVAESSIADFALPESSMLYDKDGVVIATLCEDSDLEYLSYESIPEEAVNAFIAVEDRSFWDNDGYDPKGILRVGLRYLITKGEEVHGASTITQQLARLKFLTNEVSLERKAKEILIAMELTKNYSKRQIMEFYVNDICYGNNIYGLESASKAYFGKRADELSLSQIAYLCALPNRPTYYNPYKNPERAVERRDKILDDMLECGYITERENRIAKLEDINISSPNMVYNDYETTYATDCAVRYLMKLDGFEFRYEFADNTDYSGYHAMYNREFERKKHDLYVGGYQIYTSLDMEMCGNLQEILDNQLAFNDELDSETGIYALQGALTVIDNKTGRVVALVGGRSQETDSKIYSFNRAYQAYRQPGSSIKPLIVYTPVIEMGYTPNTIVEDISVSQAKSGKTNVQLLSGTQMTLRSAVEKSKNGVAWKTFDLITPQVGIGKIVDMEFSNLCPDDYWGSAALGGFTNGVTTVEMAGAYSALVNHGEWSLPTCITSIRDSKGNEIYRDEPSKQVYTKYATDTMRDILEGVVTRGTAAKMKWYDSSDTEVFAKTGTTNDSKDGWLCGASPYYSLAVWVGYDSPRTLNNLYGGTYPAQIWKECMLSLINGLNVEEFDDADYSDEEIPKVSKRNMYMLGRPDSDELKKGYTVGNYRDDKVKEEELGTYVTWLSNVDYTVANWADTINSMKQEADGKCQSVKDGSIRGRCQQKLDEAYTIRVQQAQEYWTVYNQLIQAQQQQGVGIMP